jgi:hypothetical protein
MIQRVGRLRWWARYSWLVVLVFAAGLIPQMAHSQAVFSSLLQMLAPAVVQVEAPAVGSGSGFVVEHRSPQGEPSWSIVTACHVVLEAPRAFGEATALPTVLVTFRAWIPDVQLRAAVVSCDAARDAALLLPLDANGNIVSLPDYFQALAQERGDARLRSFPRLWFAEELDSIAPLEPIFVMGYPGPFSEFNAVEGRISTRMPVLYVTAEDDGRVYRAYTLILYDGAPDEELGWSNVLQIQILPALHLAELAELAERVLRAGHGLLLLAPQEPLGEPSTGWDVIGIEDGLVRVQERPAEFVQTIFGIQLIIHPRTDRRGAVDFEREFFKTDASIAGGFSGGPVLNLSGQVVGMIEWGVSDVPGAHFANPTDVIRRALFEEP